MNIYEPKNTCFFKDDGIISRLSPIKFYLYETAWKVYSLMRHLLRSMRNWQRDFDIMWTNQMTFFTFQLIVLTLDYHTNNR